MGRRKRSDADTGWFHVMNRGAARQEVFGTRRDGERFEDLLASWGAECAVRVHAYCLMTNHFHLLLECPEGGLSTLMHRVTSGYSHHYNRRVGRDGPLFRARFLSLPVLTDEYLAVAGRYIHRNPIDIPSVDRLAAYRWSSFGAYVGETDRPDWLTTSVLLAPFGGDPSGYASFVGEPRWSEIAEAETFLSLLALALEDATDLSPERRRGTLRVLAIVALDRVAVPLADRLHRWLDFPSPDAERVARRRARDRLAAEPGLTVALTATLAAVA